MSFNIGLSKPDMRAATENELRLIAMGQKNRAQVSGAITTSLSWLLSWL